MSVELLHARFQDAIASVPDGAFDCILTDPPYQETSLEWDRWPVGWPSMLARLLKPSGSMWCFGSQRMFWDRRDEFSDWRFVQDVIWEKHNGSGFQADRFKRVHELAFQFVPKAAKWAEVYKLPQVTNDAVARKVRKRTAIAHTGQIGGGEYESHDGGPRLMRSVMCVRSEHGRALHRTQKPFAMVEPLLLYSCPPGGKVFDPFAGSGTTGVVARQNGIDAVLVEADARHIDVIRNRLAESLM